MILPGATVGVLGSGQLGRMFAIAARNMGYRVHTLSPDDLDLGLRSASSAERTPSLALEHDESVTHGAATASAPRSPRCGRTPTGQVADLEVRAAYEDLDAVRAFARGVSVVTFEFENVPAATAATAAEHALVRPAGSVLHTTQHRGREKAFLVAAGIPVAPHALVRDLPALEAALARIGCPAVLKTAGWGYDGKGQVKLARPSDAAAAWSKIAGGGADGAMLEGWIDHEREVSVVAARGADGAFVHWGVLSNDHRDHILDVTVAPADVPPRVAQDAVELARAILERLDVVGVLCVEMFLLRDGRLLVNELAPRPHNSGHLTIDASVTSQFEQQLRAICGLPLGSTAMLRPAAMANLLGDLWRDGPPRWAAALGDPEVKLHLYGKLAARPGRKMGHLTALGPDVATARARVLAARAALTASREQSPI